MTAFVASSSRGGISYNIGSLYGAHFFLSSIVIAITILLNKDEQPIKVNARIIYRDIGFYILAIFITLFFAW
jgi:Ca2+/Na+ antiporter